MIQYIRYRVNDRLRYVRTMSPSEPYESLGVRRRINAAAASSRIAEATGAEAGLVTTGAAAALTLAAAAAIARWDVARMAALHAYLVGQPHRLRHLKRALRHIAARREAIWLTTPGAIARHCESLPAGTIP